MSEKILVRRKVSEWRKVPRKFKLTAGIVCLIVVVFVFLFSETRQNRLSKIYGVQSDLIDLYDMEMKYIDQRPQSIEDSWMPLVDLDGHIYSAYLDLRPEVIDLYSRGKNELSWSVVRIIAILPTKIDENSVECVYKYPNEKYGYEKKRRPASSVKPMDDNWSLEYSAFFVICDLVLPKNYEYEELYNVDRLPESIAIARSNMEKLNFADIHYPTMGLGQLSEPPTNFLAICVPVLHHSFDRPLDLVEFIEYYRLLGATGFTFYNSSITADVSRVLDYYKKRKVASVLKWKLPSKYVYERNLRHEGLFAALNDCLYRNTFHENFEYVGLFGIDEFLVPKKHENFAYLMEYLDPYNDVDGPHASFVFRNVFFYTMYEDDRSNVDPGVPYLYTQAKIWSLKAPNEAGDRSRYIVRGRDAVELGNYRAVKLREGSSTFMNPFEEKLVEPETALSHQYAPCEAEETGCYLKAIVVDRAAQRFTKELGTKVASVCYDIFGEPGCPFVRKQTLA